MRHPLSASLILALALLPGCRAPVSDRGGEDSPHPDSPAAPEVHLLFTYGSEKQQWLEEVTQAFNQDRRTLPGGQRIRVEAVAMGSGEAIDELLAGTRRAHLTSPASLAFVELGNARSRAETGGDLLGPPRSLVLSPVVIAMWQPMAEALGWRVKPIGWADILSLAREPRGWAGRGHPEWGAFKLGHTHPEYSNSGLISLFAEVYAATGKVASLAASDVAAPETARFVAGIESAVVHYGSSTGFFGRTMFANGPGYLSAAVLYENMVIESYGAPEQLPFPVVAVYPREGTFWSDHPAALVERPWVTDEHRAAARVYLDFLLDRPQQERALAYGFRPGNVEVPLAAPIDAAHGVDPREPQTTLEVPSVEVMDAILGLFRDQKKRSDVALVLDTSGSMEEEQRLPNARAGAERLLELLADEDRLSLLAFSDEPRWALQGARVGGSREQVRSLLAGLFASGKTALYDAVAAAYERQSEAARAAPGRILAVVVLTDGADTGSRTSLERLLARIEADREGAGVRVFTIGYSPEANRKVLERIAEASRARFYAGSPENIREVFRDISTFF